MNKQIQELIKRKKEAKKARHKVSTDSTHNQDSRLLNLMEITHG
jgi:hypothetical protein